MTNRATRSARRPGGGSSQEPSFDNSLQIRVVQAAHDAGIEVPDSVGYFVETMEPPPAAGNQWAIAMGEGTSRPGTSQGPYQDRQITFSRLDKLAEWAEATRSEELMEVDIRENRQRQQLVQQASARASAQRIEGGIAIDDATSVNTLQAVYRDPVTARRKLLHVIGEQKQPGPVADMLRDNPEQFGALHGRIIAKVPTMDRVSANLALSATVIPSLQRAETAFEASRRIERGIDEMTRLQPVNEALLRFDEAVSDLNRAFIHPKFAAVESDLRQHKRFDELLKADPVGALELAQTKAEHDDPYGMWLAMAEGTAERVREDASLRSEARERRIDPDRSLKPQVLAPQPGPQRRRQP